MRDGTETYVIAQTIAAGPIDMLASPIPTRQDIR